MNDTPRTDAAEFPVFHRAAFIQHARTLERENNELRETIKKAEQQLREAIADAAKFATDNQMFRDAAHDAQRRSNEAFVELRELRVKLSRAESFDGILDLLRQRYPLDVFDGSSGDAGAMVAALTQKLADAERERDEARANLIDTQNILKLSADKRDEANADNKALEMMLKTVCEERDKSLARAEAAEAINFTEYTEAGWQRAKEVEAEVARLRGVISETERKHFSTL